MSCFFKPLKTSLQNYHNVYSYWNELTFFWTSRWSSNFLALTVATYCKYYNKCKIPLKTPSLTWINILLTMNWKYVPEHCRLLRYSKKFEASIMGNTTSYTSLNRDIPSLVSQLLLPPPTSPTQLAAINSWSAARFTHIHTAKHSPYT